MTSSSTDLVFKFLLAHAMQLLSFTLKWLEMVLLMSKNLQLFLGKPITLVSLINMTTVQVLVV